MIKLTKDTIEDVLNKEGKIIINFYGEWCPPCKRMLSIYKNMNDDKIIFHNADIDKLKNLALMYDVKYTPTLIIIDNNTVIDMLIGEKNKQEVKDFFKTNKIL